jgi:hypothetical protein
MRYWEFPRGGHSRLAAVVEGASLAVETLIGHSRLCVKGEFPEEPERPMKPLSVRSRPLVVGDRLDVDDDIDHGRKESQDETKRHEIACGR